ncbi:hypothetical protein G3I44_06615 [Halogeometricum borinquense]|uniref:Uncharacterized protein n=2 Tax=Halogeometricum borinquense TaxID=60847 RepID=E4NWG6_HALBP|nr:hypothetical protein [Halogeometricum borinquense]ADQ69386.1 hypothetical protein Hbor_36800 [Halogeometricum borinquense DSM 11551]ELY26055.1 hypothetical protein C499_12480 [Halogeometricum borinquense DSM 11551]QIB73993.1 hypothetical protein G3I44_06615 [Halogeometricum borinquense]RYJ13159.1 hypothetical protein ELS19_03680 [Halogeometricum borinquense]
MREDELATAVVEHFETAFEDSEVRLEEPYDHYGNRGSVDVYARTRDPERVDYLVELKADPAVRIASGANEILRQYRRMERYFYKDDEHVIRRKLARDGPGVHFLLLFAPTVACVEHVGEHRKLYESVTTDTSVNGIPAVRKVAFLTNLDRANDGKLGFLSVNGDVPFDSVLFHQSIPSGSQLQAAMNDADLSE